MNASDLPEESATAKADVQIDGYGIKARIQPEDADEPQPRTAGEAWALVKGHLLQLAVAPTGLLVDVFKGARRLIRGATSLPQKLGRRIAGAHKAADQREDRQQARLETGKIQALPPGEASEQLEAKIQQLRARGIPVEIVDLGDGRVGILIVRPEHRDLAQELAKLSLPPPPPDETV